MANKGVAAEEALLLAIVADSKGSLSTLSATITGSSKRLSLNQDIGWYRLSGGQWLWVRQRGESIRFGSPGTPPGEIKLALSLGGRSWQVAWIEGPLLSLGYYGDASEAPGLVWSFLRGGGALEMDSNSRTKLEEAWLKLEEREKEKWKAPSYTSEPFGFYRRQGTSYVGLQVRPFDEAPVEAGKQPDPNRGRMVTAELEPPDQRAWRSAKSTGGNVFDAVGSSLTGWGIVLSSEQARLAPFEGGQFGRTERQSPFAGSRIVAFQSWTGPQAKKIGDELKRLRP
jgi:hypothetical protein